MIDIKKILKAFRILDENDQTKSLEVKLSSSTATGSKVILQSANATASSTKTLTLPDSTSTLADINSTQSITNKEVSLSNTTDNKLILSEATSHKLVDSDITHTNTLGDTKLATTGNLTIEALTKNVIINGKSFVVPVTSFNPATPPADIVGAVVFNTFDNQFYGHNGTTFIVLTAPVTSVNGFTGAVVLDSDDIAEGSTNLYFTTGRVTTATANKAETDLSNLAATTAINQDLLPATDIARRLGTSLLRYFELFVQSIFTQTINIRDLGNTANVGKIEEVSVPTPNGSTSGVRLISVGTNLSVHTASNGAVDSAATFDLNLETGSKIAGTGNSGNINIKTGASLAGSKGSIVFQAESEKHTHDNINVIRDYYLKSTVLANNVSDTLIDSKLTFPLSTYKSAIVEYSLKDSNTLVTRTGRLLISVNSNGSKIAVSDAFTETDIMDISFGVVLNADSLELRHSNIIATGTLTFSCKFSMVGV